MFSGHHHRMAEGLGPNPCRSDPVTCKLNFYFHQNETPAPWCSCPLLLYHTKERIKKFISHEAVCQPWTKSFFSPHIVLIRCEALNLLAVLLPLNGICRLCVPHAAHYPFYACLLACLPSSHPAILPFFHFLWNPSFLLSAFVWHAARFWAKSFSSCRFWRFSSFVFWRFCQIFFSFSLAGFLKTLLHIQTHIHIWMNGGLYVCGVLCVLTFNQNSWRVLSSFLRLSFKLAKQGIIFIPTWDDFLLQLWWG